MNVTKHLGRLDVKANYELGNKFIIWGSFIDVEQIFTVSFIGAYQLEAVSKDSLLHITVFYKNSKSFIINNQYVFLAKKIILKRFDNSDPIISDDAGHFNIPIAQYPKNIEKLNFKNDFAL